MEAIKKMKHNIITMISVLALILTLGLVNAQEEPKSITVLDVQIEPGSLEKGIGAPTLSFIEGRATTARSGAVHMYPGKMSRPPAQVGENCAVNEFIRPLACRTATSGCVAIFDSDYRKKTAADRVPVSNFYEATWFKRNILGQGLFNTAYQYFGYECYRSPVITLPSNLFPITSSLLPGTTLPLSTLQQLQSPATSPATTTLSSPQTTISGSLGNIQARTAWTHPEAGKTAGGGGRFTGSISHQSKVNAGDPVTIRGTFYATHSGRVYLEGYVVVPDPTLSIVRSSESACDGSLYWAGSFINAVAGRTYNFEFTVRTPTTPGRYTVAVVATTDCWPKGVVSHTMRNNLGLTVERTTQCNPDGVLREMGRTMSGLPFNLDSPTVQGIMQTHGCTKQDMVNFCGTADRDGDGIPDRCDRCPAEKGIVQEAAMGCHPCFGVDITSNAGVECFRTHAREFGVPERVRPIVNPVELQTRVCDGDDRVTTNVRRFGDTVEVDRITCDFGCEETAETAYCLTQGQGGTGAQDLEIEDERYVCDGNEVYLQETFTNGQKEFHFIERCPSGTECLSGACIDEGTGGGGAVEGDECTTNQDCGILDGNTYVCTSGVCVPTTQSFCQAESDCPAETEMCINGVCTVVFATCDTDTDCFANEECFEGSCIEKAEFVEDEFTGTCTQDSVARCRDGGTVVVAKCVNGQYEVTGRNCYTASGDGPGQFVSVITGKVPLKIGNTEINLDETFWTWTVVVVIAIATLLYIFVIRNPKITKKRRK